MIKDELVSTVLRELNKDLTHTLKDSYVFDFLINKI